MPVVKSGKKEKARGRWVADLGLVLQQARLSKGMTVRTLALAADVPQSTVTRYEGGQREPRAYNLTRMAQALGATRDIFEFLRQPVPKTG
jgi:transcriptional regulator with XRE-family HTH domain